ncbi:MAG: lamin tail domain-containing protein [Proteobacteria bacterium]|nr:lamin tail domain-containing protein [Pseudomonadota bacterium]
MKILSVVFFAALLSAIQVNANSFESISKDISSGLLPVETAQRAYNNDVPSAVAVQQMVDANVDVVKAVQTVAKEWSSCDDTYASVKKGVQISPDRADEIVASVATIKGCKCNAQSFWAKSRLEQRLRPRLSKALAEIGSSCSCASAGIEAAMEIVPNKAEDMIDAIIVAKNRAERTVDSIGQIGNIPEQKYWGDSSVNTKDTNLVRNSDVCGGDYNELDDFIPADSWSSNGSISNLGKHQVLCKEEDDTEKDQEGTANKETTKGKTDKLIISQYVEGQGSNQALELYNGSNEAIDLLTDNYQLEVYFHGYDFPGEVIQLKGLIEPESTFVISDANAAADISAVANQKVNGLIFKGADAIVLKTGFNLSPCECSVSTVASAIKGVDKQSKNQKPKTTETAETKQDFIKRIEQHYQNTSIQSTIIDSIGQILQNKTENKDAPIVVDKTLRRVVNTCKGDRIEMDAFAIQNEWQTYAVDNFLDSGNFDNADCQASRKDLLLSEYIEGSDDNAMIEIFNGTDRPINFSEEKYFLEVYNDDDADPEQIIYLKGDVQKNGTFVIAHSNAEKDLKDIANQTSGELDLKNARAVVLKKVVLPAYQSCYADIATWITNNDLKNIAFTLSPDRDPGTGPISDDDPTDGDDGGELASPN